MSFVLNIKLLLTTFFKRIQVQKTSDTKLYGNNMLETIFTIL